MVCKPYGSKPVHAFKAMIHTYGSNSDYKTNYKENRILTNLSYSPPQSTNISLFLNVFGAILYLEKHINAFSTLPYIYGSMCIYIMCVFTHIVSIYSLIYIIS